MSSQNCIIYDWLTFTSKIHDLDSMLDFLGFDDSIVWQSLKGQNGYRDRLYYDGVSIHYNGSDDMGVCVSMSGKGCRTFETFGSGDYDYIFSEIIENYSDDPDKRAMNITRLDIAYDDFEGVIDLPQIVEDVQKENFVSRFKDWSCTYGNKGCTVNHGSVRSNIYLRIYDKKMEQERDDLDHWVRCEIQIRGINALGFISLGLPLNEAYFGVLNNYLRYVVPSDTDTNKRRWETAPHWQRFIDTVAAVSISKKIASDYDIMKLDHYVYDMSGSAVNAMIEIIGFDRFIEELHKRQQSKKVNPKYTALILQFAKINENLIGAAQ